VCGAAWIARRIDDLSRPPDSPPAPPLFTTRRPSRSRNALRVRAAAATEQPSEGTKTLIQKAAPGEMPFPWSEKDPYKLPVSIDRIQRMLMSLGASVGSSACSVAGWLGGWVGGWVGG